MASFRLAYIKPATMFVAAVLIGSACCGEESLRVERAAHSAAERAIAAKLQQPLSWSHEGEPLEMAIGVLSERGISHLIEYPAIEDAGVNVSKKVVLHVRDVTVESLLNLLLQPLKLDWTIRDEAVVVTTRESLNEDQETRVYPVRDLVTVQEGHEIYEDYDALIELITTIVEPATWDHVGGPGSVAPFEMSSALVILQTRRSHRTVEALLRTLRQARDNPKPIATRAAGKTRLSVRNGRRMPADRGRVYARPPAWATPRSHEQHLSQLEAATTPRQSTAR